MSRLPKASARGVAQEVVRRAGSSDAFATQALSSGIERARLDSRDAAFATELALGVLRHRRRLDIALAAGSKTGKVDASSKVRAILRVAAYEILFCDIPPRASVNEAASAARAIAGKKIAGFVNALLRKLAQNGEPPFPEALRQRLGVEYSLPDWLVDELASVVDEAELEDAAAAMSSKPAVCLRPNRRRISRDRLAERLALEAPGASLRAHPFAANALRTERLGAVAALPSFREGLFTVQDVGAQRVSELASPRGVESILDACAGLGGKTTHLAELFGDEVPIDAIDVAAGKLERLRESAKRLGLSSIRAVMAADLTIESPTQERYDLVLLDAPCSGLGVLRRHPEAKWRLGRAHSSKLARLQASLLRACADRVAPSGQLVYAVCTFARREGADQVAAFVAEHPDYSIATELHSWPHSDDADAFYAARLVRSPSS